jgi:hypothetical protein
MRTQNTKKGEMETETITKIDMRTKSLGNSNLSITPVGFGRGRSAERVGNSVGRAALGLTGKEIAEIEGKNIYEPELVTAA